MKILSNMDQCLHEWCTTEFDFRHSRWLIVRRKGRTWWRGVEVVRPDPGTGLLRFEHPLWIKSQIKHRFVSSADMLIHWWAPPYENKSVACWLPRERLILTTDLRQPLSVASNRDMWLRVWKGIIHKVSQHREWGGVRSLQLTCESQHAQLCKALGQPFVPITPLEDIARARAIFSLRGTDKGMQLIKMNEYKPNL